MDDCLFDSGFVALIGVLRPLKESDLAHATGNECGNFRVIAAPPFSRRFVVVLMVALCTAIVGQIARTAFVPDPVQPMLTPNGWYRLESSAGRGFCRLPSGSGSYMLVIGCLADASEAHEVRIKFTRDDDLAGQLRDVEQTVRLLSFSDEATGESPLLRTLPLTVECFDRIAAASAMDDAASNRAVALGDTRDFFIHVTDGELNDPKQYARMTAQCVGEGSRVRIFVDQQLGTNGIRDSQVRDLIHLLEADVLPRVEAQFGTLVDVDHDGRFAIVISPWLSRLQGGRVSINGMVRNTDFRRDVAPPLGNQCDMLLLNSALPCSAALRDLLSHEIAHAACISQRVRFQPTRLGDEQDWVSEGLAHLAEPTDTNSGERIATFLDKPSQHPLVIPDYYRAGLWRDPGCRGATVLFFKWCAERQGYEFCRRLAQSSEAGCRSIEQATKERFEDLFRQWSVSLVDENGSQPDGKQGGGRVVQPTKLCRQNPIVGDADVALTIRGTAFTVVELPSNNAASVILRIEGDSAAHWQYSIRRNTSKTPTLESNTRLLAADRGSR